MKICKFQILKKWGLQRVNPWLYEGNPWLGLRVLRHPKIVQGSVPYTKLFFSKCGVRGTN